MNKLEMLILTTEMSINASMRGLLHLRLAKLKSSEVPRYRPPQPAAAMIPAAEMNQGS